MAKVPDLEHHCGSWVIVCRETGRAEMEVYTRSFAELVDQTRYEVVTALEWLGRVNKLARQANNPLASK